MNPEILDTERELPGLPPQRLAGPLLFSIVLHGVVVLAFARTVVAPSPEERSREEPPSVRVVVEMRAPPLALPPERETAEELLPEPAEVPGDLVQEARTTESEAAGVEVTLADAAAPDASGDQASPGTQVDEKAPIVQAWTPERIRAAVESSSGELRGRVTSDWMEACIRERRSRGTRDCERQLEQQENLSANAAAGRAAGVGAFANVTRLDQQWLLAEQFRKENTELRELMDAGGVVGELAETRYYMNRDYIIYLSGNRVNGTHSDPTFYAMQNFTADPLGGPKLSLLGNAPFRCRSKKIVEFDANLVTQRVTGGNVVPCVYQFTGFDIERPEAEADPNSFRVVPPIFGSQR